MCFGLLGYFIPYCNSTNGCSGYKSFPVLDLCDLLHKGPCIPARLKIQLPEAAEVGVKVQSLLNLPGAGSPQLPVHLRTTPHLCSRKPLQLKVLQLLSCVLSPCGMAFFIQLKSLLEWKPLLSGSELERREEDNFVIS